MARRHEAVSLAAVCGVFYLIVPGMRKVRSFPLYAASPVMHRQRASTVLWRGARLESRAVPSSDEKWVPLLRAA